MSNCNVALLFSRLTADHMESSSQGTGPTQVVITPNPRSAASTGYYMGYSHSLAVSMGYFPVDVLLRGALLFGVYIKAPDFWKLSISGKPKEHGSHMRTFVGAV